MTDVAASLSQFQQPRSLTPLFGDFVRWFMKSRITRTLTPCKSDRTRHHGLRHASTLVRKICAIAGEPSLIEDIRVEFELNGLSAAVLRHDNQKIYDWLMDVFSYQGVADAVAEAYLDQHGRITQLDVRRALSVDRGSCPKLESYWHFENCGYRKTAQNCNRPEHYALCPLPTHDLRNGSLNQAAYSLHFFLRDVAAGDIVRWIDKQLRSADRPFAPNRAQLLCNALLEPLSHVHGVSYKVLSMSLASLLLAGDPRRTRWVIAGAAMIVVDTLVHAWLHRTGILRSLSASHAYGPRCYGPNGCASIIDQLARRIDARRFNPDFPKTFPRFVQKAIWRFCAQSEVNRCNGNQIDDRARCQDDSCPLYARCERVALDPNRN